MNTIVINDTALSVKAHNGQRVVTFKEIDKLHKRPDGTAKRNFNKHHGRFVEGVDFFKVFAYEFRTQFQCLASEIGTQKGNPNIEVILLTQTGYLMLVKSFTDPLAWDVQRALVNNYFRVAPPEVKALPEPDAKPTLDSLGKRKAYNRLQDYITTISVMMEQLPFAAEHGNYSEYVTALGYITGQLHAETHWLKD